MKIKNITIQGFRGFNERRTIDFHEWLTLIYAPNSYGKTSISEAFEWLLYGITSKVKMADSKEEYKGSYRNRHLLESLDPLVVVRCLDETREVEYKATLSSGDVVRRFVDEREVESWPFEEYLSKAPAPFILQHALKYLLLVKPDERFRGFARLLGLEKLDEIQRDFVSLCTKPEVCVKPDAEDLLSKVKRLEERLSKQPALAEVEKTYKSAAGVFGETYSAIVMESGRWVPQDTEETAIHTGLMKIREDAVGKIFRGHIGLSDYSGGERQANTDDENFFVDCVTGISVSEYIELLGLATVKHILERAEFFDLGVKLLDESRERCPLCGQVLDDRLLSHIRDQHGEITAEKKRSVVLQTQRTKVEGVVKELKSRLDRYQHRQEQKSSQLLAQEGSLEKLKTILSSKHEGHFNTVKDAISELADVRYRLQQLYTHVIECVNKVETSITEFKENASLIEMLGKAIAKYIAEAREYVLTLSGKVAGISAAGEVLKQELDALAGMEEVSVLIDLLEQRSDIEKCWKIKKIFAGLKELRKYVDQYVANKVLEAISSELTSEVMEWYGEIRTTGDPDVHFAGFDIERTVKGELKARRVQIKAKSYGKELISAVSSLSESKLNALGLCVSLAVNLKGQSPFDFLIIDDPIQSWDAEHEVQFIGVIRKLVERGKQVILMSHNKKWIEMVRSGCRTINGWYYEITGYTEVGPSIEKICWESWSERLKEVDAIIKDETANSIKLGQAEEEMRFVFAELTCEIYRKIKGVKKESHVLNSAKVRKMLMECGVDEKLVDRITLTFETTDDAHHAPVDYAAHRQRLRQYYGWAHELSKFVF